MFRHHLCAEKIRNPLPQEYSLIYLKASEYLTRLCQQLPFLLQEIKQYIIQSFTIMIKTASPFFSPVHK